MRLGGQLVIIYGKWIDALEHGGMTVDGGFNLLHGPRGKRIIDCDEHVVRKAHHRTIPIRHQLRLFLNSLTGRADHEPADALGQWLTIRFPVK